MPWTKTPNVAMFKGADWGGYISTVPNCSPPQAQRLALLNPKITFFFFCRDPMVLEKTGNNPQRTFNAGDAVFFSGEPWFGSAPQCDSYQKSGMSVAYIGGTPTNVAEAGCYVTAQGLPAVDVVCIFAANINLAPMGNAVRLAPQVKVPPNSSLACGNPNIVQILQSNAIQNLRALGITVLLTFLNNHDASGWSEFSTASDAGYFVQQLQSIVDQYHLDGIDIDDEYSNGTPISTSLAMVTSLMQQAMPNGIISKALFADLQYFGVPYKGVTLEQTLTYGWEMSYGGKPQYRLPPYVQAGMTANTLVLGFWSGHPSPNPSADVAWLKANKYEGVMVYAFESSPNSALLGTLVNDWIGPNNWNKKPNCP
jgi:hypothetical protein